MLDTAMSWRALGIATTPILKGRKVPALRRWKTYRDRLPTERELQIWFQDTEFGLAVITGWRDLVVVDWDDMWAYSYWLASLDGLAAATQDTYRVRTKRGMHLYFYCPKAKHCWTGKSMDIKAAGSCVTTHPSIHPSGCAYKPIGSPSNIATLGSLKRLFPEYDKVSLPILAMRSRLRDIYDEMIRLTRKVQCA